MKAMQDAVGLWFLERVLKTLDTKFVEAMVVAARMNRGFYPRLSDLRIRISELRPQTVA